MAPLPVCNFENHFWPKKKHLFYVYIPDGAEAHKYTLRFCETHASFVDEYLTENECLVADFALSVGNTFIPNCLTGREPIGQVGFQVYVTGYPPKNERKDYWAMLCDRHPLPAFLEEPHGT